MVILPSINNIYTFNIFELMNKQILTYTDCFSKTECVILVNQIIAYNIFKVLDYVYNILQVPRYL